MSLCQDVALYLRLDECFAISKHLCCTVYLSKEKFTGIKYTQRFKKGKKTNEAGDSDFEMMDFSEFLCSVALQYFKSIHINITS